MALLDAFFVSLVALIPDGNIGQPALVMGILALLNTLSMVRHLWEDRRASPLTQGLLDTFVRIYQIINNEEAIHQRGPRAARAGIARELHEGLQEPAISRAKASAPSRLD